MNILMTSETFLPALGGAEIHVFNLMRALAANGHQIVLVTNEKNAPQSFADLPGVQIIEKPWSRRTIFGTLKLLWALSRDADVVHAHYSYRLAALAGIIGAVRRKPVVVTLHGLGTLDEPQARFPYKQAHAVYRLLSLRLASRVISTSEDLAVVARRFIPGRPIAIIPSGYDERIFGVSYPVRESLRRQYAGRTVIITVRRLVPKNGIHFLVEALPYIRQQVPNILWLAVGDGRMHEFLKKRTQALGVEQAVQFLGSMDNASVAEYLRLAQVAVFPSTAESSSLACAEAMASGIAVVASRVGGLIELLGKNEERGTLVTLVDWEGSNYDAPMELPPERYKKLAEAVVHALSPKVAAKTATARAYAEQTLAWPVIARKTGEVYTQLLTK